MPFHIGKLGRNSRLRQYDDKNVAAIVYRSVYG